MDKKEEHTFIVRHDDYIDEKIEIIKDDYFLKEKENIKLNNNLNLKEKTEVINIKSNIIIKSDNNLKLNNYEIFIMILLFIIFESIILLYTYYYIFILKN
jgi:hypothetical protein